MRISSSPGANSVLFPAGLLSAINCDRWDTTGRFSGRRPSFDVARTLVKRAIKFGRSKIHILGIGRYYAMAIIELPKRPGGPDRRWDGFIPKVERVAKCRSRTHMF